MNLSMIKQFILNIRDKLKKPQKTAILAKERLQIIIAHERTMTQDKPDYLPLLQKDLLDAVGKYVKINQEDVTIDLERKDSCSILELNVILPNSVES